MRKRYHTPLTPCDRLIADPRTSEIVRERVQALRADLDPVRLLADMRAGQQVLVTLTDCLAATATPIPQPPIAAFLAGLHTAWRAGEVRPTAQAKPKPRRGRRRPDPLAAVVDELRAWFEADPSRSGRDLLVRLQAAYPGRYFPAQRPESSRSVFRYRGARAADHLSASNNKVEFVVRPHSRERRIAGRKAAAPPTRDSDVTVST